MIREEKVQKIIEKAIKNGFRWYVDFKVLKFTDEDIWVYKKTNSFYASLEETIFSHDFVKAYFKYCKSNMITIGVTEDWQMYLIWMALETDRVEYLLKFL